MTAPPPGDTVIEFRGVEKYFGAQHVLRGVDLTVQRGRCTVIIGRSGCGKSVLLKTLIGLIRPDAGEILVDGQNVVGRSEVQFVDVRKKIGIVFQGGALFDSLSVEANIAFPLKEERTHSAATIRERVADALDAVGLAGTQRKMPSELSGGMRKRVAVARALVRLPEVMLYDEPTTGLDPIMTDSIDNLINKMGERYSATSLVVTHDMKSAYKIADRMALLHSGTIYATGTPDDFRSNPDPIVHKFINGISEDSDNVL